MSEQVLWINTIIAVSAALGLLVAPKSFASLLGLPRVEQPFYARMLGVTLGSIACAIVAQGYGRAGLGIEGMALINLLSGGALVLLLLFGGLVLAKRGRWLLRGLATIWICLGALGLMSV